MLSRSERTQLHSGTHILQVEYSHHYKRILFMQVVFCMPATSGPGSWHACSALAQNGLNDYLGTVNQQNLVKKTQSSTMQSPWILLPRNESTFNVEKQAYTPAISEPSTARGQGRCQWISHETDLSHQEPPAAKAYGCWQRQVPEHPWLTHSQAGQPRQASICKVCLPFHL